jgi:hypothetical protein
MVLMEDLFEQKLKVNDNKWQNATISICTMMIVATLCIWFLHARGVF